MRNDLSATALAELEIGSGQDHNARHERHTRMLDATYEPVHWGWVVALILVLCVGVFSIGHNWPVSFNPFAR